MPPRVEAANVEKAVAKVAAKAVTASVVRTPNVLRVLLVPRDQAVRRQVVLSVDLVLKGQNARAEDLVPRELVAASALNVVHALAVPSVRAVPSLPR